MKSENHANSNEKLTSKLNRPTVKIEKFMRHKYELFLCTKKLTTLYKYCREWPLGKLTLRGVKWMWQQLVITTAVAVVSAIAKEIIEER
ncbi:hypothetical protein M3649_13475 [Ureibacillus chungkukjangi]|nr:hypothetical protein [Ureibacillus chungkukjangi]